MFAGSVSGPSELGSFCREARIHRDSDLTKKGRTWKVRPFEVPAQGARVSGTSFFQIVRGLFVRLFHLGLRVGVRCEAFNRLAETYGAAPGYFRLQRVKPTGDVQVLRYVCRCDALADVLEAAARSLGVLACQRLDLPCDRGVMAQHIARRTVRHVGSMGCGPAFVRPAHIRASSRSAARRWSAGAWMRALSGGWCAKNERHRCHQHHSRVFHFLLLFLNSWGPAGFVACPLPKISSLVPMMHPIAVGM